MGGQVGILVSIIFRASSTPTSLALMPRDDGQLRRHAEAGQMRLALHRNSQPAFCPQPQSCERGRAVRESW